MMPKVRDNSLLRVLAAGSFCVFVAFAACSKPKLDPQQCTAVRGKALAILDEAATCKTDKDCLVALWPGCPHESNQDQLHKIRPINDEYLAGGCTDPKSACPKEAPEVRCNQFVCEKREKANRTDH